MTTSPQLSRRIAALLNAAALDDLSMDERDEIVAIVRHAVSFSDLPASMQERIRLLKRHARD